MLATFSDDLIGTRTGAHWQYSRRCGSTAMMGEREISAAFAWFRERILRDVVGVRPVFPAR
jgi:hypothetical protein